jgi:hypothetical protein
LIIDVLDYSVFKLLNIRLITFSYAC